MKLIVIYGAPAVGKLTTARALSEKTKYPVLHNHMTLDLVINFFPFNSRPFYKLLRKIRTDIVKELLEQKAPGLIWTSGLPNTPDNIKFYKKLENVIKKNGGTAHYIKLICDPVEQKQRIIKKERGVYKKLTNIKDLKKFNLDFSTPSMNEKTLIIDNTKLSISKVVSQIMKFISPAGKM